MDYDSVLKANIQYHDKIAKRYDREIMRGNFRRVEPVFKRFKGGRMLDMGCGTGEQLRIAKKYFKKAWGVDCSPEMVKLARKITLNVVLADISNTKLKAGKFDFINCFSVFHHCYEQEPVIKEAYRLLKEGGIFYSDNDPNQKFYRLFKWWLILKRYFKKESELRELAEYHQKNGLNPEKLKREFEGVGFGEVQIEYHYPENPDLFTKTIMFLNRFFKSKSFYYYFSIIAKKC